MSLALYRKYRPQTWQELTGQNHIKTTLAHEIETGKISHAYLFTGPRGIGKTTTARLLAKSINCEKRKEGESEPCNDCDSCRELVIGNDLDVLEVDAASNTGVDNVRENIIANARFTPAKRKFKVFIIDEVHMLSVSAFNALLKTLEEPPSHAVFILATTEVHKVPATIISRCQRFDFKKVNAQDLIARLTLICQKEGVRVSQDVLTDIVRSSEGSLRDAESLLGQILSLGEKEVTREEASLIIPISNYNLVLELVNSLVYRNVAEAVSLINKLVADGVDLIKFTDELIELLRKMILAKISGSLKTFSFELEEKMEKSILELAQKFSIAELIALVNIFTAKKLEIKSAVISQMPLEIAVIEYCSEGKEGKNGEDGKDGKLPPSGGNSGGGILPERKIAQKNEEIKSSVISATLKNSNSSAKADLNVKINLSLDEVKNKWHNFLIKLQESNASLVFILKVAEPLSLEGNVLTVGFKYAFHEQRVNQAKMKDMIEKNISEFFGVDLIVQTSLLAKEYESRFINEQTKSDEVEMVEELPFGDQQATIDSLVKAFGGKVVE